MKAFAVALLTVALPLLLVLGACSSSGNPPAVEPNVLPTDYKTPILERVRGVVADPSNIRDAFIAEPTLKQHDGSTRYISCFRFNAKDERGQYAGNREMAAFFFNGQLTQIVNAERGLCTGANYQPFPELTRLCRTLTCR